MSHQVRITARHGSKDLDVLDYSRRDGAKIQLWGWHGTNNQRWDIEEYGDGTARIVSVESGLVLDIEGGAYSNLAHIIQKVRDHSRGTQLWRIEYAGDGTLRIRAAGAPEPMVLDVLGWSTSDGAQLVLYRWHGGNNQRFHIHDAA